MKVLTFNGSNRADGCTARAIKEIESELRKEGIEVENICLGAAPVRDCIGCNYCASHGKCVFADDLVNEWAQKAREADAFIFGTPVYYAHPSGRIMAIMDRLFYSAGNAFDHKPVAFVASARRAGTTASLDALYKYAGISNMPIVSSSYWNIVHGKQPSEVEQDKEGMETMRNIGKNMAWLLKCIQAGASVGAKVPKCDKTEWTNFIR